MEEKLDRIIELLEELLEQNKPVTINGDFVINGSPGESLYGI